MQSRLSMRTRCIAALLTLAGVSFSIGGTLYLMHLAEPTSTTAMLPAATQSVPATALQPARKG